MQTIARILSAVLSVYMVVLIIRVMLTWFRSQHGTQFYTILARITDPYLNWFKRFSFLKMGMIDFSPIVGFILLGFVTNLLNNYAAYGTITFASFLTLLIYGIRSIVSFIVGLFIVFTIIRLLSVTILKNGFFAQISPSVDSIIAPLVSWVRKVFFNNRFTSYTIQLGVTIAILLVLHFGLRVLFIYLQNLAKGLPF